MKNKKVLPGENAKITLAINTASSKTGIALFADAKLLAEKSWKSENREAEKLMPEIARLLGKCKVRFEDIKRVLIVKGPGSFTGLRIGVTVGNTIAYLNGCEVFGVDTCEYWWHAEAPAEALLIYAGSKGIYVSTNQESAKKATLVDLPDFNSFLKIRKITKVFGDISKEQIRELKGIKFIPVKKTFGKIIGKIVAKIIDGAILPVKIVEPIYVKKPAITESKKQLFA